MKKCPIYGSRHKCTERRVKYKIKNGKIKILTYKRCACGHEYLVSRKTFPLREPIPNRDVCQNPFLERLCGNPNVIVAIMIGHHYYPICKNCWDMIAQSNLEW